MADVFQALRKTVINSFTAVAWQLRSRLHIFTGYVSVQSDVPERYSGFATSLVKSDYPHVHINRKEEDERKKKEKTLRFYYLPAENWELRVERLRELHGRLKIYLRAAVVNISTAVLQMTKEFLESRLLVPPRWKMVVGGKLAQLLFCF